MEMTLQDLSRHPFGDSARTHSTVPPFRILHLLAATFDPRAHAVKRQYLPPQISKFTPRQSLQKRTFTEIKTTWSEVGFALSLDLVARVRGMLGSRQ